VEGCDISAESCDRPHTARGCSHVPAPIVRSVGVDLRWNDVSFTDVSDVSTLAELSGCRALVVVCVVNNRRLCGAEKRDKQGNCTCTSRRRRRFDLISHFIHNKDKYFRQCLLFLSVLASVTHFYTSSTHVTDTPMYKINVNKP
jgi:hypothetical protein